MKTLFKFLFAAACISLLVTCQKPDRVFIDDSSADELRSAKIPQKHQIGEIVNLKGFATYKTWEVNGGQVWQDNKAPATAELKFLDDNNFDLAVTETGKGTFTHHGTIANSGEVTMKFAVFGYNPDGTPSFGITDILTAHACATKLWGNDGIPDHTIIFYGKLNGEKFNAAAKLMVNVACPCASNDMFDPCLLNANGVVDLYWEFGYDMEVVKPHDVK